MIKVLLIGLSRNLGGIETYIYNLIKYSNKEKFSFDILCAEKEKIALEEEFISFGCEIIRVTPRKENYKRHVQELREIFEKREYDYLHYSVMSYSWCEPILIANKYSKAKIIIHSHNAGFDKNSSLKIKMLHKVGFLRIKKISFLKVACGEAAGKFMFNGNDFTIFNNGIDLDKFKFCMEHRKEIRREMKVSEETTVFGLIAKLEYQKNVLFLIDIFYEITKLKENVVLAIVGEGSLKEAICERIEKYNIKDKVLLMGRRNDANKAYSAFDIFLMPSLYEGLSISLIEAQVSGLRCYTSDTVDPKSNITGNVEFISLDKTAKEWAEQIINGNNQKDKDVLKKVPEEYNAVNSYQKVYEYYEKNR